MAPQRGPRKLLVVAVGNSVGAMLRHQLAKLVNPNGSIHLACCPDDRVESLKYLRSSKAVMQRRT